MHPVSDELLGRALAVDEGRAFLSGVVEPLGDAFDPRLGPIYNSLFTRVVEQVAPDLKGRLRKPPANAWPEAAKRVYVLISDHAGSGCRGNQRTDRRGEAAVSEGAASCSLVRAKTYELFEADSEGRALPCSVRAKWGIERSVVGVGGIVD